MFSFLAIDCTSCGSQNHKTVIDNVLNSQLFVLELQKHNMQLNNNCLKGNVCRLHVLLTLIACGLFCSSCVHIVGPAVIGFYKSSPVFTSNLLPNVSLSQCKSSPCGDLSCKTTKSFKYKQTITFALIKNGASDLLILRVKKTVKKLEKTNCFYQPVLCFSYL